MVFEVVEFLGEESLWEVIVSYEWKWWEEFGYWGICEKVWGRVGFFGFGILSKDMD